MKTTPLMVIEIVPVYENCKWIDNRFVEAEYDELCHRQRVFHGLVFLYENGSVRVNTKALEAAGVDPAYLATNDIAFGRMMFFKLVDETLDAFRDKAAEVPYSPTAARRQRVVNEILSWVK